MRRLLLIPAVLTTLLAASGCTEEDVGLPCYSPVPDDPTSTVIEAVALDCRSRICARYGTTDPNSKPTCTKLCNEDGDCPGKDAACTTDYRCVVGVTQGDVLNCCKICVCGTLIDEAVASARQAECDRKNPNPTCAGI